MDTGAWRVQARGSQRVKEDSVTKNQQARRKLRVPSSLGLSKCPHPSELTLVSRLKTPVFSWFHLCFCEYWQDGRFFMFIFPPTARSCFLLIFVFNHLSSPF